MTKEIYISSTPHETRLAIVEDEQLVEVQYERENEYSLAGSIYKGKVTRVLPGMQSAFVDIGLERDAFLYVTDFLEDQDDSGEFERTALPAPKNAAPAPPAAVVAPAIATAAPEAAEEGSGELSGARRWRGRRGRRRGREESAPQPSGELPAAPDAQAPAPPVENEVQAEAEFDRPARRSGPAASVLPGESLSKYGGGAGRQREAEDPRTASQPRSTSRPSTLVDLDSIAPPTAWDGSVLPGESLARRKGSQPPQASAPEAEEDAVLPNPADAFLQPLVPPHDLTHEEHASEDESPAGAAAPPRLESSHPEPLPEAEYEEYVETAETQLAASSDAAAQADASASFSYDPDPPREFRLPWSRNAKKRSADHDPHTGNTPEDRQRRQLAHAVGSELAAHTGPGVEVFPGVPDFVEEEDDAQSARAGFSPGAGQVEEETIDEDEFELEPLRRHNEDHDGDELVEETMVEDADIGEFVRDTYVNERTQGDGGPFAGDLVIESEEPAESGPEAPRQRRGRRGRRNGSDAKDDKQERRPSARKPISRRNMQGSSIPVITELLKPGQEILVQIAKEPIAKKGARITSHIALPGRFLVYMPTVNHVGVSRKISSEEERQRLKRILLSEKADAVGGFIVRTAADNATEQELRADIRFLINLWLEIKQRSESSKPPALIYHDLNLVERILRDQVTDKFSAIWVDTEAEYERVVRFLNRFQPSLVRHVKLYSKETPLFEQFGIQDEINKALKSKVWLKSGGSIVINQTEALVAIDINTGKYVGKTARLEDTILKTNLDAIPEIVRQIRLRDLGGIIVIDFIDMDERRNRQKVMAALEEELQRDRAPSKVLQFNDFGLVAITRKRVKQSLERTLSMPCITCQGTGMVKNPTTVCNEIYVELRKMHRHLERGDIMLRVHPEVVKQLKNNGSRWLQDMEEMAGRTILIKSDAAIHPEQFDIH